MSTTKGSNAFKSVSNNIDWSNLSKDIRKKKEWNQENLAKELDTHSSTVSKIERGETKPSIKTRKKYKKLAEEFGFFLESYKISRTSIGVEKELLPLKKSTSSKLNEEEKEVISLFQKLSERAKRVVKEILISFKDQAL